MFKNFQEKTKKMEFYAEETQFPTPPPAHQVVPGVFPWTPEPLDLTAERWHGAQNVGSPLDLTVPSRGTMEVDQW